MARPPNLLFLWTDQQRHDTLAVGGNTALAMPNLNRLAAASTAFTQAHCTQPVCTPSRGCIMTGLYPHAHGAVDNNRPLHPHVRTLAEYLPPKQYATGYYGKWHLGDELFAQHGFEEWVGVEDMYNPHFSPGRDRSARSHYHHWLLAHGQTPRNGKVFGRGESARLPEDLGKPAFLAEQAGDFIRRHNQHPFALYVNFLEPHMPYFGPRDNQYPPADVALPENFNAPPNAAQPLRLRLKQALLAAYGYEGNPLLSEADWRRMIANYWGLCSLIDTHIGRILQTLENEGLLDNTLIVFTSDHGDQMGSHRLLAKSVMFAESTRIPLLVRLPGQRTGQLIDRRISQIDLMPTLLDALGLAVPDGLHGRSRLPWLTGRTDLPADDIHCVWSGDAALRDELSEMTAPQSTPWPAGAAALADRTAAARLAADCSRTVITQDGWRFTWSTDDLAELYNLNADPGETTNLAAHPAQAARVANLADRIQAWQKRTGDPLVLPNPRIPR